MAEVKAREGLAEQVYKIDAERRPGGFCFVDKIQTGYSAKHAAVRAVTDHAFENRAVFDVTVEDIGDGKVTEWVVDVSASPKSEKSSDKRKNR